MISREAELIEFWRQEAKAPFAGWDFSHVASRMIESKMLWSYAEKVCALLPEVTAVQQKLDRVEPLQFHTRKYLIQVQKP